MKLADLATGSDWIVWIVFVIFAALSITLLQLQKKKRKNMMKRSYAEQWELECLL